MNEEQPRESVIHSLAEKVENLSVSMEKMRLAEYLDLLERPRRLLWINFLMGMARGFGMAVGFTILAALIFWALQRLAVLNLPLISDFIAEIVRLVQVELQMGGPNFGM